MPLDDKDINKFYKCILGGQLEFTVMNKYLKKVHVLEWGKPCITLFNQDLREYNGVDVGWLNGNCIFFNVTKPLFALIDPLETPGSIQSLLHNLIENIDRDNEFN